MYADSILKMLKDIRKTVRASSKLQPGTNAFAQFLEEVSMSAYAAVVGWFRHPFNPPTFRFAVAYVTRSV